MRFMMFMIPNISDDDWTPQPEIVQAMGKYNEELAKAGVLLALDGLHPGSAGVQVSFRGGKAKVTDGPFAEAKEVIGGYWLIDVKSKEEAVEWAKRVPGGDGNVVEVRQIWEAEDFEADLQKAAAGR
jgi:hypothetical protein